jgi:hypothetical protein
MIYQWIFAMHVKKEWLHIRFPSARLGGQSNHRADCSADDHASWIIFSSAKRWSSISSLDRPTGHLLKLRSEDLRDGYLNQTFLIAFRAISVWIFIILSWPLRDRQTLKPWQTTVCLCAVPSLNFEWFELALCLSYVGFYLSSPINIGSARRFHVLFPRSRLSSFRDRRPDWNMPLAFWATSEILNVSLCFSQKCDGFPVKWTAMVDSPIANGRRLTRSPEDGQTNRLEGRQFHMQIHIWTRSTPLAHTPTETLSFYEWHF